MLEINVLVKGDGMYKLCLVVEGSEEDDFNGLIGLRSMIFTKKVRIPLYTNGSTGEWAGYAELTWDEPRTIEILSVGHCVVADTILNVHWDNTQILAERRRKVLIMAFGGMGWPSLPLSLEDFLIEGEIEYMCLNFSMCL